MPNDHVSRKATAATPAARERAASRPAILERLVASAREMVPVLRERAAQAEESRRIPAATIRELIEAGFFRIFQPARFGGYELDYGSPQIALCSEIGRGCGSTAWVFSVVACHNWMLGMFPLQAQDEVWGNTPDVLLSTALIPEKGGLEPTPGGFKLAGRWKFSSGVDHVGWTLIGAPMPNETGAIELQLCLVPRHDYEVIDTWFVGGLRGTGSNDVVVSGAFVPEHRVVPMHRLIAGDGPGGKLGDASHIYRLPLMSVFPYNIACPTLGMARGAIEAFTERARSQLSTLTRTRISEIETNQLHVAEAAVQVDCATALLERDAAELNDTARAGIPFALEQRARYRRDLSYAAQLCMRAVDTIHYLSGAHALFEDNPLQRHFRDVHAANAQLGLRWDVSAMRYGRSALGLAVDEAML